MSNPEQLLELRRQADALEVIAEEMRHQSAVLTELAHAQHLTAVSTNEYSEPVERAATQPNYASLLTRIEDQKHTREVDERITTDGGDEPITVQVGQVRERVYPDDTVSDLFERLHETGYKINFDAENTMLCRPFDLKRPTVPDEEDRVDFDLEDVEDGDHFELYLLSAEERPAYPEANGGEEA